MDFSEYSKCLVDIELPDEEIVSRFGKLHEDLAHWLVSREDGLAIPAVNIIKYIVACYDSESPVVKEHSKRWTVKKRESAKLSGMLNVGKTGARDIDAILYCKNVVINKVTVRYLAMLSDRDFLMYAIYNEMLISQSEQILKSAFEKPGDVAKAKTNIEVIQDDISKLEQKIFGGDDVRVLKNILQEESRRFVVTELRPENIVTKHENKEQLVEGPYGDYVPEKLRFLDDK